VAKRNPNPKLQEIEAISDDVSTLDHYPPISPVGDGSMPFFGAVHWIATEGLQLRIPISSAGPTYLAAAVALRDKHISGKAITYGENQDGEFEQISAVEYVDKKFIFDFEAGVEDLARRDNRIEIGLSDDGDCLFRANSFRAIFTKIVVRKEDILREWPFDKTAPVGVKAARGKKPLIKEYLRQHFSKPVPGPAFTNRKALKRDIENSELATRYPQLKSIDVGTLKTAIDEYNAEFQQS
jgi:hypothetical protein